jgi:hypothetical protein
MSYSPPIGHFNFAQIGHYYFALTAINGIFNLKIFGNFIFPRNYPQNHEIPTRISSSGW